MTTRCDDTACGSAVQCILCGKEPTRSEADFAALTAELAAAKGDLAAISVLCVERGALSSATVMEQAIDITTSHALTCEALEKAWGWAERWKDAARHFRDDGIAVSANWRECLEGLDDLRISYKFQLNAHHNANERVAALTAQLAEAKEASNFHAQERGNLLVERDMLRGALTRQAEQWRTAVVMAERKGEELAALKAAGEPTLNEPLGDARQRYIEKLLSALSFMHADDITRENAHSLVDELWQLMLDVKARGVEA